MHMHSSDARLSAWSTPVVHRHWFGCLGTLVVSLAAALATPEAEAANLTYVDVGKGEFGAMAWAGITYDGGPSMISGGANWSYSVGIHNFSAAAVAGIWDGSLHADAYASSCNNYSNDSRQLCLRPAASATAGAAIWDHIYLDGPENTAITPTLHVDGVASGFSQAIVRAYIGSHSNPRAYLDSLPHNGFQRLGPGNTDLTLVLGEIRPGSGAGLRVFLELEVQAYEFYGGSFADFSNTARFQWVLPEGVSVRSTSGQFMTAPVPSVDEPSTAAMLSVALLAWQGWSRRKARRAGAQALRC